jgi:uncharacterized protein YbjT (DUF2867 family)
MKILLFGASGTAGGAVLRACLATPAVDEVRAIVRKPLGLTHAKLREIVHANYADYAPVADAFRGVDACLFCLGISVTQVIKHCLKSEPIPSSLLRLCRRAASSFQRTEQSRTTMQYK